MLNLHNTVLFAIISRMVTLLPNSLHIPLLRVPTVTFRSQFSFIWTPYSQALWATRTNHM